MSIRYFYGKSTIKIVKDTVVNQENLVKPVEEVKLPEEKFTEEEDKKVDDLINGFKIETEEKFEDLDQIEKEPKVKEKKNGKR